MVSRKSLVAKLVNDGVLHTPAIIAAFQAVDRRDFVPEELQEAAYIDEALPIGEGQTISQPFTVAFMLELLQPTSDENILDIGSGSGWQTALLAHIVGRKGHITAIEIVPNLHNIGKQNVSKYSFIDTGIVEMHCMNAMGGYPKNAPFDKIIAAAAGDEIPPAWLSQTKIGGRIIAPIGSNMVQLIKKADTQWDKHEYPGFAFVPLVDSV